ncbi:CPBP family intramembrane glutamic endopeptidase [Flavobacterium sedimenticola]|uniref:Type II CAAX endopeptidase family protein n=1 Tax=Flavobacterium sedimenticola TaxID=3043286 RepID=A0ABT6XNT8_9FLAO|nr:type II CAAX endopeptidase family protein [Flavobacterium sedimenticola]MDI9256754.1 type II CAAX endopeptidase family protein [Flavobacterium sedimenticola]
MNTAFLHSIYGKIWALLSILALNAFVFNPWTKFPYTFVILIAAVLLISYGQYNRLTELGFHSRYSLPKVLLIAVGLFLVVEPFVDFVLQPFTNWITNSPPDYGGFEILKGNTQMYQKYLLYTWISAAFGEEILYRGFLFQQLAILLPQSKYTLPLTVLLSSVLFAVPHLYMGWSGVAFTFCFGVLIGLIYIRFHYNLWITILLHGLVDTLFITLAYTGRLEYYEWVSRWWTHLF